MQTPCLTTRKRIRQELLSGEYVPQPVQRKDIPKLGGKELEKIGHRFRRYADDCNLYVPSNRRGRR